MVVLVMVLVMTMTMILWVVMLVMMRIMAITRQQLLLKMNLTSTTTVPARYDEGRIYTATGPILLAVNPFKSLPIYDKQHMDRYTEW